MVAAGNAARSAAERQKAEIIAKILALAPSEVPPAQRAMYEALKAQRAAGMI